MTRIKIIDNIVIKNGRLRAIDSLGREKRAFLEQGNLEGECAVYSPMMMLIVHNIIDDYDLIMNNSRVSANVKQLRKQFLSKRRVRGYKLKELQDKLIKVLGDKISVNVVVVGYAEYAKYPRLFCLDPSWGMPCSAFWNNIIDINLDNNADIKIDYEHMSERYVLVTEILLINEELDIVDSPLPF